MNLFICQQPGACSEGTGNYTLLLNTTNGIHEADINFTDGLEALVTVDWIASSAALGVYTSNGFSRSEFYPFSKSECMTSVTYCVPGGGLFSTGLNWL